MGFWSGIKHALNSTLGTTNFEPLDTIIKGQKRIVASDTPLVIYVNENLPISSGNVKDLGSFVPSVGGTCRMNINATTSGTNAIEIYKNGSLIHNISFSTSIDEYKDFSFDFNIEKGAIYLFKARCSSGYASIAQVKLCGSTIDSALYSYSVN